MNRRQFMQLSSLVLAGGAVSGPALSSDQLQLYSLGRNFIEQPVNLLSTAQRKLLQAVVETIIPRTDTPGALDAKVDRFVELCVAEFMTEQERAVFIAGLDSLQDALNKQPREQLIEKLVEEPSEQQGTQQAALITLLTELEEQHSDAAWYQLGNRVGNGFDSTAPFICQLKELSVVGFFMSEVGATQVLRHNPMPGQFDGETVIATDQPSWARNTPGDLS
jgi:gluconate 2-dehydrogenase gamma chain